MRLPGRKAELTAARKWDAAEPLHPEGVHPLKRDRKRERNPGFLSMAAPRMTWRPVDGFQHSLVRGVLNYSGGVHEGSIGKGTITGSSPERARRMNPRHQKHQNCPRGFQLRLDRMGRMEGRPPQGGFVPLLPRIYPPGTNQATKTPLHTLMQVSCNTAAE